jgi:pyoverdine/dityrosine biosynthesis protein Dit1
MFTRKNICPLKRGLGDESTFDLAEIASLIHLNNFASLIASFYPHGCRFIILSEGLRFLKAFNLCYPYVRLYQKRLKDIVKKFNLNNLEIYDFEDFLFFHLSAKEIKQREENYQKAKEIYEKKNWPIFNPNDFLKL